MKIKVRSMEVLKLLKEGKTVREIAELTKSNIPNITAHKKRLILRNLWVDKDTGLQWPLDLDQVTDILIDRLEKAKSVPELQERIKRLENQKAALENELSNVREQIDKKLDKERRYKQAIQSGDINRPIFSHK